MAVFPGPKFFFLLFSPATRFFSPAHFFPRPWKIQVSGRNFKIVRYDGVAAMIVKEYHLGGKRVNTMSQRWYYSK